MHCIPENILNNIKLGMNFPTDARYKQDFLIKKFELMFAAISKVFNENKLNPFDTNILRSRLFLHFDEFLKCTSNNDHCYTLKKFLREHPDILVLKVDKSNNVAVWPQHLYNSKMIAHFSSPKFEKLN